MFYYISGKLAYLDPNFAVVDAAGVGYKLTISGSTHSQLAQAASKADTTVKLFTHMAVREDGVEMFGFSSEEELSSFKLLITVSGVGPKAAISILTQLSPRKLAVAICTDNKKEISKASGIGPKTAARIVLELKDKLSKESNMADGGDSSEANSELLLSPDNRRDAEDALAVLGYSRSEAANALRGIDTNGMSLDDIIRAALKKLIR